MKKYDVVALGELLIDFTQSGYSEQGNPVFEANPGGAPCNVLAMLAKLGKKTAFIGKVGNDMLGSQLVNTAKDAGIETKGLIESDEANTTLAFVHTKQDGDRDFSFFRKHGADTMLRAQELENDLLENCNIFHFGTLSLTHQPAKAATMKALEIAKASGALVSFDPNLREPLWDSLEKARQAMAWGCAQCDILKIAEEELEFLTGAKAIKQGADELRISYPNIKILFVTKGKNGAECFYKDTHVARASFDVKVVDTTGAGDTFCGSCLYYILENGIDDFGYDKIHEMLTFANAAAALVTTKKGAIRSMPCKESVEELIKAAQQ